jgi:rhodanese-related sulfurtransferase
MKVRCGIVPSRRVLLYAVGITWTLVGLVFLVRGGFPGTTAGPRFASVDNYQAPRLPAGELLGKIARPTRPVVIDVRTRTAFARGHIPGAISIPVREIRANIDAFAKDRDLVLYCGSAEVESLEGAKILHDLGYTNVAVLAGGFPAWQAATGKAGGDGGCGCTANAESYKIWILQRQHLSR